MVSEPNTKSHLKNTTFTSTVQFLYTSKKCAAFVVVFLLYAKMFGQPPVPCTTGNENTCKCNTSPILCSIEELDGYSYSMTHFLHRTDGPYHPSQFATSFMCPGSGGTVSHNPTWFRFPAWCTDLDLQVCWSNCTRNMGPPIQCNSLGIQSAVYRECFGCPVPECFGSSWSQTSQTPAPYTYSVGCEVESCGSTSGCVTINLTGLEIGKIYYFMVDGCCGAACDVEIDVLSSCDFPEFGDFDEEIEGPENACVGETINFTSGPALGANTYAWFVDGVLVDQVRGTPIEFDYTFLGAGTYEICVTAWHSPCRPLAESMRTQCHTITIGTADAGTPVATPTPLCPGGTVDLSVSGHIDDPYYNQYLVVVNSAGIIVHVYEGTSSDFTFPNCGEFTLYSLNASGQYSPTPNPTVGQPWSSVSCSGDCCEIASVPFEFAEQSSISFDNPPPDVTLSCIDDIPPMMSLPWTSICGGSGTANGVENAGTYTLCTGGTRTRTWTVVDGCGDNFSYVQNITIEPLPIAEFINPPSNTTINCSQLAGLSHPSLNYSNMASGTCGINGTSPPVTTGTATVCLGGILTNTWTFTDGCMRTITYVQTITVQPSALPTFVNPPDNITINCEALATFSPTTLGISNNDSGACLVSGTSIPTQVNNATVCGGTITVNWQYTDFCMRTINHSQVVTVVPAVAPSFVNPPQNITINCEDLAGLSPTNLSFTNNGLDACLFSGSSAPTVSNQATVCGGTVTYVWSHTDQCNNTINHTQIITVTPILPPAFVNPPANVTIACHELAGLPPAPGLPYTNGGNAACLTLGNAMPVESGMANICGGSKTYTWIATDQCNNSINHTQIITVTPIAPPAFVNPPTNMTIACHELATLPPNPTLAYTNGGIATCLTSGNSTPTQSGMANVCGGMRTYTWNFTDQCSNTITHTQNITVTPIAPPAFVNPPMSVTIACHELATLPPAPTLSYTNGGTATCLTTGDATPTESGMATVCGGTKTRMWNFTDQCNNSITHTQNITVTPIAPPAFVNPPTSITIACHELATLPPAPTLSYTNGGTATCLTTGDATPTESGMATVCGGTKTRMWNFTDQCNNAITHTQNITVTPIAPPAFVNPPTSVTIACHELATLPPAPTLSYTNGGTATCLTTGDATPTESGMANVCGGTKTFTWNFTDQCNNAITHTQNITVTPIAPPAFVNPPTSVTIACHELATLPPAPTLSYTNGGTATCLTTGDATPTESGMATVCGGTKTFTWNFTDQCNNAITHTQNITVTPIAPPAFVNPPGNLTIACNELANLPVSPTLSYTNNGILSCLTDGNVSATINNTATICGGNVVYTWQFTDQCNNAINHSQTLTVTPVAPPAFINPPGNLTIPCSEATSYNPLTLSYTNNGLDACLTSGTVAPTLQGNPPNICGSMSTYVWTFTDQCNNAITHNQIVSVTPIAPPVFQNPPQNVTVNCDQVPSGPTDLSYTNGDTGSCSLSGSVSGTISGTSNACGGNILYTWQFTDQCNNTIQHIQTITVNPAPLPVFVNPPANITVACNQIPSIAPNLEYNNNALGGCSVQGFVPGVITGFANECGGVLTITWTYTDPCNNTISHVQTVTVTPALPPTFTSLPPDVTVTCANVPGIPPPLTYSNNDICPITGSVPAVQSGSFNACGGVIQYTWQINTLCNVPLSHVQTVTVLPSQLPTWIDPPANITVSCADANPNPTPLSYTNSEFGVCAVTGFVLSTVNSNYNACGGFINKVWNFTDICGRTIFYSQSITVLPSIPPAFSNLPQNITVSCGSIPTSVFLSYSNNTSGVCSIQGQVLSTESGNYTACGGTMFNSWTYTDQCNRTISYQRQITVLPANDPEFLNPPADITLACDVPVPPPNPIRFNNNSSGICNIFGQVSPVVSVNGNVTTFTYTWVHPCTGNILQHIRNITSPPDPILVLDPDFANACEGQGFTLADIDPQDVSGSNSTFTYYWNMPFEPGNEIIELIIYPVNPVTIYVLATNDFGCTDFEPFTIDIVPAPNVGVGSNDTICTDNYINLFSYLTGTYDTNGFWRRTSGPAINLANPSNLLIVTPGSYAFEYRVLGTPPCNDDYAFVNIEALPKPEVVLINKFCSPDKTTYSVVIQAQNLTVSTSAGTIIVNTDNTVTIQGIPIGDNVIITVTHTSTQCVNFAEIAPPNCDCPAVSPPQNPTNVSICLGQVVPELSVTTLPATSVNWYSAPFAGTLLQANSLTYTPSVIAPGIYTYYTESYLVSDPSCISNNRTPVVLTIYDLPDANNASLETCDDNTDGFASFDLLASIPFINSSSSVNITFHANLVDAQNGSNPLLSPFTNTIPGAQTIYSSVINPDGCRKTALLELIVNPQPNVTTVVTNEVCDNENNGSVTVSTTSTGGSYEYRITSTAFSNIVNYTNLQPGIFSAFVQDSLGCIGERSFTIEEGLLLDTSAFSISCNNNNTRTITTDDFYTINWTLVNNKTNVGTYRVLENNVELGVYSYGTSQSITRNALGQIITLVFEDVATGCEITVSTNPLIPCSTDCEIVVNQITEVCNDNNTPTNPNDDSYTISFQATVINNPSSTSFNVFNNGNFAGNFTYGTSHNIIVIADGSSPTLTFRDGNNLICETTVNIGPLNHCSNLCAIELTQLSKVCNNNNTKLDPSDDFYTITINASPLNAPGASNRFRVFVNGVEVDDFEYLVGGSFTIPADGTNKTIEIRDFDNPGCIDSGTTGDLISCSTDCQITVNNLVYTCNNNNTPSDDSDDYYNVEFLVTAINGSPSGRFRLSINNVFLNEFSFGFTHNITLPADGAINELTFTDSSDPSCFENRILPAFTSCSGACVINAVVSNITCDNNGTATNTNDDRFFFDLEVTGFNTSASYTFLLNNTSGSYSTVRTLGPFTISGGTLNSFIADGANPSCLTSISVTPPPPCSDGCALVVSNFQKTGCNNNGTNDNNDDDFYSISFIVNTQFAGATQYNVTYNSTTQGPFNYGQLVLINNIPANGLEITFNIRDISASNCSTSLKTTEFPCSVCTQAITVSINPTILDCNNNIATLTATSTAPGVFNWTGPNNYNQFGLVVQASFPGWYYFKATYPDMCESVDSVQLFADPTLPQAIGGPDKAITCKILQVTLNGSSNLPDNNARYIWYDDAGNVVSNLKDLVVTNPGTYYLEVINITNNCVSGRDAVLVDDQTDKPLAVIYADPGNILDCVVSTIILSGEPQTNVIFNWTIGETFLYNQNTIIINQPGTYILTALDTITGCDETGQLIIVDFTQYPSLTIDPVAPITCATNKTVINASNSPLNPNMVFTWFNSNNMVIPGQTQSTLEVSSPGTYYVMLTDTTNGCRNIDTIFVDRIGDFPQIDVSDDVYLYCGPTQTSLQVNIINPTSATTVSWTSIQGNISSGASNNIIQAEGTGYYVVEVEYINSGCKTIDSVFVSVNTEVPESFGTDLINETCVDVRDGVISIVNIEGGTPPYQVKLNNTNYGQVTSIPNLRPGTYSVVITDANGCTKDTVVTIEEGADIEADLQPTIELKAGESSTLEVLLNVNPNTIASIQWTPRDNLSCDTCLITELTAVNEGTYVVKVTDINGCEATASIRVIIKGLVVINVPNIIKSGPIGDNNKFFISGNEGVLNIETLKIYDRWGELVFIKNNFKPNNPDDGWDGTFSGRNVEQGVYVYYIEYRTRLGIEKLVGDLTVLFQD
ncbi:MAG: gliding motility-associated C-terminal domain-containing protein [Saprospiraceae bacterium]|nr:gliding motility-associated C-terminal domain-containing protein [Saprospiraceae bacterium]